LNVKNGPIFTNKKVKENHKKDENGSVIHKGNPPLKHPFVFSIATIEKKVGKIAVKTFD
jgi:hypothetical protein